MRTVLRITILSFGGPRGKNRYLKYIYILYRGHNGQNVIRNTEHFIHKINYNTLSNS